MRNDSDKNQQNVEREESILTDLEEEIEASSVEHVNNYKDQSLGAKLKRWKMYCHLRLTLLCPTISTSNISIRT